MNASRAVFIAIVCWAALVGNPSTAQPPNEVGTASRTEGSNAGNAASNQWLALPPNQTILRLAESHDGRSFTDRGGVLVEGANAPDILRLPNGELMVIMDCAVQGSPGRTRLAVVRSRNAGRTWSSLRYVTVTGMGAREMRPRQPDLVILPDGKIRLFFVDQPKKDDAGDGLQKAPRVAYIRSAVSSDGTTFRVDPLVKIAVRAATDLRPTAARTADRWHLFVSSAAKTGTSHSSNDGGSLVYYGISKDGTRFARLRPPRMPNAFVLGNLVSLGNDLRAYGTTPEGIISLTCDDAHTWRAEGGLALAHGWEPTVAPLRDGYWLMVYCRERDATPSLPEPPGDAVWPYADSDQPSDNVGAIPDLSLPQENDFAPTAQGTDPASGEIGIVALDQEAALSPRERMAEITEDWFRAIASDPDGFAPKPDVAHPVDYVRWLREHGTERTADNAYDAYDSFMPDPANGHTAWPEISDFYNDPDYDGPPGPWDPAQHPKWEKSNRAIQELLAKYREATLHDGYDPPIDAELIEGMPDGAKLLIGMLIPHLNGHRTLTKAALADGWRMEGGKVQPERLLESWCTVLRNAKHLSTGTTLIEGLLSVGQRNLVQQNARWALKHDVFAPEHLEQTLDALRRLDRDDRDPMRTLRGEHAFAMDITQYLFSPAAPSGAPMLNFDRARGFAPMIGSVGAEARFDDLFSKDYGPTLEAFDAYYRELGQQWRIGYPDVRTADIEATAEAYMDVNALTQAVLPSLSRMYMLRARTEASRRATQLAYATHIFRARNGRWPASIAELPAEFDEQMRTDPFTGRHFGYRLDESGPTIYSASENGIDDGGIHSPRWDDGSDHPAGSDDYVFWPPQQ